MKSPSALLGFGSAARKDREVGGWSTYIMIEDLLFLFYTKRYCAV